LSFSYYFLFTLPPPLSSLFPYTTLFRSSFLPASSPDPAFLFLQLPASGNHSLFLCLPALPVLLYRPQVFQGLFYPLCTFQESLFPEFLPPAPRSYPARSFSMQFPPSSEISDFRTLPENGSVGKNTGWKSFL